MNRRVWIGLGLVLCSVTGARAEEKPAPAKTVTSTIATGLSAQELELARYLDVLEELELLEDWDLAELLSVLEDEDDR
jgi:hypothetical protein